MKKNWSNRFYRIFRAILTRCNNKNAQYFHLYGGKGVVCEWSSYEEFVMDMYPSYLKHVTLFGEKETTIDRIDSNGNYCRDNCRWATLKEQARNVSTNRLLTLNDETKTVAEWSEITGISRMLIAGRIDRLGWSIEKTLSTTVGKLGTNQFS